MKLAIFNIVILSFLTSSCASYVNKLHSQISREEQAKRGSTRRPHNNPYVRPGDRRPVNNPVTLNGMPAVDPRQLPPKLQQDLERMQKKRTKSSDMVDNSPSASLWDGSYDDSFLFIKQNVRRPGDIVIIDVLTGLKDQIQVELKRAFPLVQRGKTATNTTEDAKPAESVAAAAPAEGEGVAKKVHDKISTQVIEEINKDYLLLRGRKEVVFRKKKRFIEIQALVPKKAITETNSVHSDRIIEPKIYALRYGL